MIGSNLPGSKVFLTFLNNAVNEHFHLCFRFKWSHCCAAHCRMCGLVSCNGKMWPDIKTHWFWNECSLLTFLTTCTELRSLALVSVFIQTAFGGYVTSVWRLVFLSRSSKCPWKCPDLLAAPVFIKLTLHSSCLVKGSSHQSPTGLVSCFSREHAAW